MDYFLLKQSGTVTIPKAPKTEASTSADTSGAQEPSVRVMEHVGVLGKFDYIAREHLVSDRLKQLLELYLPGFAWRPCVFIDPPRKEQQTFWFLPALPYLPRRVVTASNGMPAAIFISEQDFARKAPGVLRIRSPKGTVFFLVHLSVAESILRRGICGLELEKLSSGEATAF
ncbi:MAG: hypothetical protein K2N87_12450 [Eubacterium sp.]|nr:hypothetical protein [Eubacterium sp.]